MTMQATVMEVGGEQPAGMRFGPWGGMWWSIRPVPAGFASVTGCGSAITVS